MKRHQLEHILRAAGAITDSKEFVVIGSQAILGAHPDAPADLLVSQEVDLYIPEKPQLSTLIDGTIGELSPFHQTFGYYGHGVGPQTATLPTDWESRVNAVSNENTNGVTGWCLHPLDICYSKLAAGRPKDLTYCRHLLVRGLVSPEKLRTLIAKRDDEIGQRMDDRLQGLLKKS